VSASHTNLSVLWTISQLIFERQVNLNADKKRFWLGEIESIDSKVMNESMPVSMNYFEKNMV
jgi:hypothetical protein